MSIVENHGEIYQVVLGAPLPGLGPVQSVKRQDGRWVVLTPKGIIVSHARPALFRRILSYAAKAAPSAM